MVDHEEKKTLEMEEKKADRVSLGLDGAVMMNAISCSGQQSLGILNVSEMSTVKIWVTGFSDHRLERKYQDDLLEKSAHHTRVTAAGMLLVSVVSMLTDLARLTEVDAHERAIHITRMACSLGCLVTSLLTLVLPKIYGSEHIAYGIGFGIAGVLLAFSKSYMNNKMGETGDASAVLSYLAVLNALGSMTIFTARFAVSWITVLAHILFSLLFRGSFENGWHTAHSIISLVAATVLMNGYILQAEWTHRTKFVEQEGRARKQQRYKRDVIRLREEKQVLMQDAYGQMLKHFDLAIIDYETPRSRAMGSAAEELINLITDLHNEQRLSNEAAEVTREVVQILNESGGDIFKPYRDSLAKLDGDSWVVGEVNPKFKGLRMLLANEDSKLQTVNEESKQFGFMAIMHAMGCEEDKTLQRLYDEIDEFEFDVIDTVEPSHNRPLAFTMLALLGKLKLISKFNINLTKLRNFCQAIEDGYMQTNPYHNALHAADVTRATYFFIKRGGFHKVMTDLELIGAIVAAAIHDFRHPGVTNNFLINSEHDLAIIYNDVSVLENHHVASAYMELMKPDRNIFENISINRQKELRKVVVQMVLATDLARHKENLDKYKLRLENLKKLVRPNDSTNTVTKLDPAPLTARRMSKQTSNQRRRGDKLMILKMALKSADLGHAMKPLAQHIRWTELITEEFFMEGDSARKQGMKVVPLFDRKMNKNVGKSQAGFIEFLVLPLFELTTAIGRMEDPVLKQIMTNLLYWKEKDEEFRKREKEELAAITGVENAGGNSPPATTVKAEAQADPPPPSAAPDTDADAAGSAGDTAERDLEKAVES